MLARPPRLADLSWMLITPAIASEPYWAAAPSRSTSTRLMASPGIRLRSTAALPRPTVPLMLSKAVTCRRLPLTRTSVWSGLRPRRVAGRSASEPSAIAGAGKLNAGTSWLRIRLVSVWPGIVDRLRTDHVDRDRAVGDRAVGRAGAGDDDRLLARGRRLGLGLGLRRLRRLLVGLGQRRAGEGERAERCEQKSAASAGHDMAPVRQRRACTKRAHFREASSCSRRGCHACTDAATALAAR